MNKMSLKILLVLSAVSSFGAALETLVMPKGVVMPFLPKSSLQHTQKLSKKELTQLKMRDDLPPKRMLATPSNTQNAYSLEILVNPKMNETTHVAVLLKDQGLRLFKKRTQESHKHWYYWVKSQSGAPMYKVELCWIDKQRTRATMHLWSWDDKEQLNLSDKQQLISLFGKKI